MKKRIHRQFVLIGVLAVTMTFLFASLLFYDLFQRQVMDDLKTYADVLKLSWSAENMDKLDHQATLDGLRVTLIESDGTVTSDNEADAASMSNHSSRKEVKDALKKGEGTDIRQSETLQKSTFYYAVAVDNGKVLRVARESDSFWHVIQNALLTIILIIVVLIGVCMILAYLLTRSIVRPIEQMAENIDHIEDISVYRELIPFVNTIKKQHEDIVKNAQIRQDFTANVSHELKTPLTSISGYSELIENGMVNGEDIIRFAGEIHRSSNRLLTLINDIIRLSELDVMNKEEVYGQVDLYVLAQNCVDMLQINAKNHNVSLKLTGTKALMHANKEMMEELLYNLCDNAIRYNKPGGEIFVSVLQQPQQTILTVTDTGIGISKEHQSRIFERFYRVDKSRSKQTGGTGLGLAIVKHIVAQHHAKLRLESEPGQGTKVQIVFHQSL